MKYSAERSTPAYVVGAGLILLGIAAWAVKHVISLVQSGHHETKAFVVVYTFTFLAYAVTLILALLEKPIKATTEQNRKLGLKRIICCVPVYNEDADYLKKCIESIFNQSRKVDLIHVVVNGPNTVDYTEVKKYAYSLREQGQAIYWTTQALAGKRNAQATTARKYLKSDDFFLSIDSDAILDKEAIKELLKPMKDPKMMSVAGVIVSTNNKNSFLTRTFDLWFVCWQLLDRSAASTLGAVIVNSGMLALYRAPILLDNLEGYTNETFFGRPVEFSDDSMLTLYALERGKTIQQPTSFCFALMPENLSHHFRQQVRWSRGSFIRSWWRIKYLPLNSWGFLNQFFRWVETILSLFTFVYFFIVLPLFNHSVVPWVILVTIVLGYAQGLRYLTVKRSDESRFYQFCTYLLEPIPALWSFFVLRFIRYYAMVTCLKTGWGTRKKVEVSTQV